MSIINEHIAREGDWREVGDPTRVISPRGGGDSTSAPSSSPSPSGTVLSATRIRWSWTSVSDATGYKVSLDGGAFFDVGDVLLYEDTGLSDGQTRTFSVTAYNTAGSGPSSGTISATTSAQSAEGTMQSSVSWYDTTWTFDTNYLVGEYVTGEPWVVAPSGLTLTGISPAPTGSGSTRRNGGMLDPHRNSDNTGYDGRDSGGHTIFYSSSYDYTVSGFPLTVPANSTLISAVSAPEDASTRAVIRQTNPLTVLDAAPDRAGYFRPPFVAGTKVSQYHVDDIDLSKLPMVAPPGGVEPNLPTDIFNGHMMNDQWAAYHSWRTQGSCDAIGGESAYGYYHRYFGQRMGDAMCILLTQMSGDKNLTLATRLIQWAIDSRGSFLTLDAYRSDTRNANSHRRIAFLIAGTLLGDPDFFGDLDAHPWIRWPEQWQFRFSQASGGFVWGHNVYNSVRESTTPTTYTAVRTPTLPTPDGLWREERDSSTWTTDDVDSKTLTYHNQISANSPSMAIVARLMDDHVPGFRTTLNIEPMIAYADRWRWEYPDQVYRDHITSLGLSAGGANDWGVIYNSNETVYAADFWKTYRPDSAVGR